MEKTEIAKAPGIERTLNLALRTLFATGVADVIAEADEANN